MRTALRTAFADLPTAARRLILGTVVMAAALFATVLASADHAPSVPAVLLLAVAIVGGEGFRVDLPYRRAGVARFTLGDAALTAGLLTVPGVNVVLAAAAGIILWQLVERVPAAKFALNVAMYVGATSAAALIVGELAPPQLGQDPRTFAAVTLAMVGFLILQTLTVGGILALTSDEPFLGTARRLAPVSGILAIGNIGLGLLAVLTASSHPWALPALGIPLVLLFTASRQEVAAQVDRERSAALVDVEHALAAASSPEGVSHHLVSGAAAILGCNAAVWRGQRWETPVPASTGPCPVDGDLSAPLVVRGAALGPPVDGTCIAVGVGRGVLVAWAGELALGDAALEWLERLGRSGRGAYERAAAAAALEQERATLRAVVDGTGDGILVLDGDGTVLLCNPALVRLAQVDDPVGRRTDVVFGEGPWAEPGIHDVIRPGTDRTWRVSVTALQDDEGGTLTVAAVHDVSAERRVARMKDDMLSIVSHELRTPLTPIKASAQLLRRRWERMTADQREQLLAQVEQRADHLANLVDDLLLVGQLSSGEATQVRLSPRPADLAALLRDDVAQLSLARPDYDIVLRTPPSVPTLTDPLRVRQIVDNLVENACKFSPAGSRVEVELQATGGWATLRIADAGRGIPPEDLARIFERFERVEDPLHMTTSGAGLGLYIVRALCRALGGDIGVTSTLGAGTTFTVRLPLLNATLPAVPATQAPPA